MRCSVIEIGSNTVKCTVYDITGEKGEKKSDNVLSQSYTVGLINYMSDGILSNTGIKRLSDTLFSLVRLSKKVYSKKVILIATAGLRMIKNCDETLAAVKKATGYKIDVISGEAEAIFGFTGLKSAFGGTLANGISVDLGGGSTEIVRIENSDPVVSESISIGALKLFSENVSGIIPTPDEIRVISDRFDEALGKIEWLRDVGDTAYIVGGSGRALSSVCADIEGITTIKNGFSMTMDQIDRMVEIYTNPGREDVKRLITIMPDRIHMTVPGIIAYSRIFKAANIKRAVSSFSKLRDGYIIQKFLM